jgi:L-ascorbate metabolism protein UlaG (beta-lactamase superfamily)
MPASRRRIIAALGAVSAAGLLALTGRNAMARYYDGPVSDHFDGTRFFDPKGAQPRSVIDLIRWRLTGTRASWPERSPSPYADRPPAQINDRSWRISFVGHASLLLQTGGLNLLLDPVWSERVSPVSFAGPKRVNDPGIAFEALPPINAVLVSHCHYDHLDLPTLSRLAAAHRPRVITPLGNDAIMRSHDPAIAVEAYDWGDRVPLPGGASVSLVPVQHWSARGLTDRNKALWAGFVIDTPAGRILHVGDSGYGEGHHFRRAKEQHGPFRLAILPIGAYEPRWFMRDQHMNPAEAVQAFHDCGAELALAHHHGTFPLTDEVIDAPPLALAQAIASAGIAAEQFRVLQPGQVWQIDPV